MKQYGIYNIVNEDGKSITQLFEDVVTKNDNNLDNFYYSTMREAYNRNKESLQSCDEQIIVVMYEEDTELEYPFTYRLIHKNELFSDFPLRNTFNDKRKEDV